MLPQLKFLVLRSRSSFYGVLIRPIGQEYEKRKRRTGHSFRSRSQSPARGWSAPQYYSNTSSPTFYAEPPHDMVTNNHTRSLRKPRSRASTGTTTTELSMDQIDPYAYVRSRRAARSDTLLQPPPSGITADEYDFYTRGRYDREWELHEADVRSYHDPRWGYYI